MRRKIRNVTTDDVNFLLFKKKKKRNWIISLAGFSQLFFIIIMFILISARELEIENRSIGFNIRAIIINFIGQKEK